MSKKLANHVPGKSKLHDTFWSKFFGVAKEVAPVIAEAMTTALGVPEVGAAVGTMANKGFGYLEKLSKKSQKKVRAVLATHILPHVTRKLGKMHPAIAVLRAHANPAPTGATALSANLPSYNTNRAKFGSQDRFTRASAPPLGKIEMQPAAMTDVIHYHAPITVNVRDGVRVKHAEMIGEVHVENDGNARIRRFEINPGLALFNWLRGIANSYTYYRFRHCRIRYVPRSSTDTDGTVAMAPLYTFEPFQPGDLSSDEALIKISQMEDSVQTATWAAADMETNVSAMFPADNLKKRTRYGAALNRPGHDAFDLLIITQQQEDPSPVLKIAGQIWLDYEVDFTTPTESKPLPNLAQRTIYLDTVTLTLTPQDEPLDLTAGTGTFSARCNGLDLVINVDDDTTPTVYAYQLPPGAYVITIAMAVHIVAMGISAPQFEITGWEHANDIVDGESRPHPTGVEMRVEGGGAVRARMIMTTGGTADQDGNASMSFPLLRSEADADAYPWIGFRWKHDTLTGTSATAIPMISIVPS